MAGKRRLNLPPDPEVQAPSVEQPAALQPAVSHKPTIVREHLADMIRFKLQYGICPDCNQMALAMLEETPPLALIKCTECEGRFKVGAYYAERVAVIPEPVPARKDSWEAVRRKQQILEKVQANSDKLLALQSGECPDCHLRHLIGVRLHGNQMFEVHCLVCNKKFRYDETNVYQVTG